MTYRGPFLFLVALLFISGAGTATFRHLTYRIPLLPGAQQSVWQIEARIEYRAIGGATQAYLTLPPEQSGFRIVSETGASSGFGFDLARTGSQRRAKTSDSSYIAPLLGHTFVGSWHQSALHPDMVGSQVT